MSSLSNQYTFPISFQSPEDQTANDNSSPAVLQTAEAPFDPGLQPSIWLPTASRAPSRDEQLFGLDLQAAISNGAPPSTFVPTAEGDSMVHTPQPPCNTSFQPEYRDVLLAASRRQPQDQWAPGNAPPRDGYTHTVSPFTASVWEDTRYNNPVQSGNRSPSHTVKDGNHEEAAFNSTTVLNNFYQLHDRVLVGDPTHVMPTGNIPRMFSEKPDTQLGGSTTAITAIPSSFLSLVTAENRCTDFHQLHDKVLVGDPTRVIPTENILGMFPEKPDTRLGGSTTASTAIPNLFLSLVTAEGRCKYSNNGQPCQTVPRAERKEFFVRHILNVHVLKEMRRINTNLLNMEDAEILTTPEKLQRAKDYLWHCLSCDRTSMRQDAIKDHIRQVHSGERLIPVQNGVNLRRGIRGALDDILAT